MKNVLLVSPTWVGIHEDIINELRRMGYYVEFISEYSFKKDPLKINKGLQSLSNVSADRLKSKYWETQLGKTKTIFDFLLVIDGQGVNQHLFTELKLRNPNVYCVNYLYDTTYGFYHFECCFHYYDKVYSFDKKDASMQKIYFLPIYWSENKEGSAEKTFRIFGFGSYNASRYKLYSKVQKIAEKEGISNYIKLYYPKIENFLFYKMNIILRKIVGRPYSSIPIHLYNSDYITSDLMSTDEYRRLLSSADVILDTKVLNQDGLTARFMWALGARKKIITTNESIKNYDFYDPKQVFILNERDLSSSQECEIINFINEQFSPSPEQVKLIEHFRIDNWLKTIFSFN